MLFANNKQIIFRTNIFFIPLSNKHINMKNAQSTNTTSEIISEYLLKWKDLPNRTLAIKIFEDYPTLFTSIEHVRSLIRNRKGSGGAKNRRNAKDKTFFTKEGLDKLTLESIQEGIDEKVEDYIFPKNVCNTLVISDVHIPYHTKDCLVKAIQYGQSQQIDSILINGDWIDFAPCSEYTKDPYTKMRMKQDLDEARAYLYVLRNTFPNAHIYYKHGNHEDWLEKYLMNKAPILLDMLEFKLSSLLNFQELRIHEINSYQLMKYGKLSIVHGHELKQTLRSVNPARTLYLKTKVSTLVAHHHVTSEHTESDIEGNVTTCFSMGCLSQLKPKYAGLDSRYNHGFVHLTKDKDGHFTIANKRIIKGNIY